MNGRMPGGFSVQETYLWIAANCPGMERALLLTFSTSVDAETRTFLQERGVPALAKPFEVADLIARVRAVAQKDATKADDTKASSASAGA
jgi:DNA-binding response OmpR family regulator